MMPTSIPNQHAATHGAGGSDPVSLTGDTAGGDLSGTYPNPTVANVNGVAITAAEATLLSQMNGAQTRNATGTLVAGEQTVYTGSTGAQTLTLPGSTAQVSSANNVTNLATVPVTIAAGAGTTLNFLGAVGSFILAPNCGIDLCLIGTVWYGLNYTGFGVRAAFNQQTANWTYSCTANTFTTTVATGTAPTITLPNDNRIYRLEWSSSNVVGTGSGVITLGLGTSTTVIYAARQVNGNTTQEYLVEVVAQNVTGTGQTIVCVVADSATTTITFGAAAGGSNSAIGPAELAAYRVA